MLRFVLNFQVRDDLVAHSYFLLCNGRLYRLILDVMTEVLELLLIPRPSLNL